MELRCVCHPGPLSRALFLAFVTYNMKRERFGETFSLRFDLNGP